MSFLTKNLISNVQSDKFLFISSIDVYPDNIEKIEDLPINIDNIRNIYGKCKLICEEIVKKHPNHLILRPCSLIGKNKIPVKVDAFLVLIISVDPALGLFTQVDNVQELVLGMTDETIET